MTDDDIKQRINEIEDKTWDDEVAHSREDELHRDSIEYIANSDYPEELKAKAHLILTTGKIDFARWCA